MAKDQDHDDAGDSVFRLRKLELEAQAIARKDRNQMILTIFTAIMQLITPGILLYQRNEITSTVRLESTAIKEAADIAAVKAEQAVNVVQKSTVIRDEALSQIDEKVQANLQQWKAYKTKMPEDEQKAEEALVKAELISEIRPPAKVIP